MKALSLKKLFIFLVSIILLSQDLAAKVYLVAVGISTYPAPITQLRLPANDAMAIKTLIDKNGNSQTAILLNEQATKAAILSALHAYFDNANTDDIIIFFFSGHGYNGGFAAYNDKLSYELVRQAMKTSKCKNKMIFADACYSGKMRQGKRKPKEEHKDSNIMLFLSSRDNETSIERSDMENGFFTTCLKDGMSGKADANRDRTITAKELFLYVSKNVKLLSRDAQHPVMWGLFPNDMPVIIW